MTPYKVTDDMLWRNDPEVEALSKLAGWVAFHREAGKRSLYFDRPVKDGRKYVCVAFTVKPTSTGGWQSFRICDGAGRTPLDAMGQAYRESSRTDAELDRLWATVCGVAVEDTVEDTVEDFESMFD